MNNDDIFKCPICKNIPVDERETFLKELKFKKRTYKKGERIVSQNDEVDALYILYKGSVRTEMITKSGTVLHIETIQAPNPLASAFLFAEENRFPVDVIALEDSEVILIPKEVVMKQMATNEHFLKAYMTFNSGRTHFLSERIKLLSLKTIKGKLAYYILERTQNGRFSLGMTQTDLAEYFGVTRPSLARSLSEMIETGIIRLDKKEGEVLNMNALKELITI